MPCAPGDGGSATLGDFQQGPQPDCTCLPIEGNSACDAIYGGKWDKDIEGNPCPEPGTEDQGTGGESGDSGASGLVAAMVVLTAAILL